MEREVRIRGLLVDPTTNSPVVLLKDTQGDSILPIWVGPFEASSIASEIEKKSAQRPITHDLLRNIITQMNATVEKVLITELKESTFYAFIQLKAEENQTLLIDSRPSDAIALALRCDCPIFIMDHIFDSSEIEDTNRYNSNAIIEDEEVNWPKEIEER